MTIAPDYSRFLARSAAALAAAGAQVLLAPENVASAVPWAAGWDQIVLADGPGAQTLYAFAHLAESTAGGLQERLDLLVQGLSSSGAVGSGPAQVTVVAVAVFPGGIEPRLARKLTRLAPTRYYPGLRPHVWVVDLAAGHGPARLPTVYSRGIFGKPEGKAMFEQAARGDSVGVLDPSGIDALQRRHAQQTAAFYRLMRGRQPFVTYALVAINVLIFLVMYARGGQAGLLGDAVLRNFGAMEPNLVEHGQWWRLFTDMFLHAGIAHILFNMVSLLVVGTLAERLYGSARFLAIYLGAGLIGSLTSFGLALLSGNVNILAVGASGAIFGVAAALITIRFHPSDVIPKRLRDRISSSMVPLVVLSLLLAYFTPGVDNSAHIGGLLGGAALSFLFPLTRDLPDDPASPNPLSFNGRGGR